jgi:uncharacterized protein YbcC (UPF0753/DUF2309 family)
MNDALLLRERTEEALDDSRLAGLVAPEALDADDGEAAPPAPLPLRPSAVEPGALLGHVRRACSRVAPLWPLKHFVAVNPFLGYADASFESTVARLARVTGARALMPRDWYRRHVESGRITRADVAAALALRGAAPVPDALAGIDADAILARVRAAAPAPSPPTAPAVLTYAEAIDRAHGTQFSRLATEEISKWCAAYFDEGQSAWRMPWRSLPLYSAWRAAAALDRTPETLGLRGFRAAVARLPDEPLAAIALALDRLGLHADSSADYLDRALASVSGWTAHARYREWVEQLHGGVDESPIRMLAIRLSWDAVLAELCTDDATRAEWRRATAALGAPDALDAEAAIDAVLQHALELAHARELAARLRANAGRATVPAQRAEAQAVFCIDVRSEIYRRALESVAPGVATHGFAGFFGFALEYVRVGQPHGTDHCPALLKPGFVVRETLRDASPAEERRVLSLRAVRRRAAKAWKSFRTSAVSCFGYVEAAGLAFAPKLLRDALAAGRPSAATEGLDAHAIARLTPEVAPRPDAVHSADGSHRATGLTLEQRIAGAATALTAMGLTRDFARLVLLAGHGSTTANNPYGSGLDCGACGGHTGEANARVAAAVCNDPLVRAGLVERGIEIPADSWFVAGLHDTTLDDVRLYDTDLVPSTHAADLARLREHLARAGALARAERRAGLGIAAAGAAADAAIRARSRDWSEVRPEWGLAGNAAFVAAPRARTQGLELRGRSFLHDYDAAKDPDGWVLELIMTAPMVVASWINLQYYGSSVDNAAFGSGNKVLHNVVGALGVLEGNGGDLRVGLPWQSVHDGRDFVHEPLRLGVWIEADTAAMDRVLAQHAGVRQLLDNGWLALHAIRDEGRTLLRYARGAWVPLHG